MIFGVSYSLQREEEEAYASSQGAQGGQPSLGFAKFEEKKSNEKTRKVTTVKKFFTASSKSGQKKGNLIHLFIMRYMKCIFSFDFTVRKRLKHTCNLVVNIMMRRKG